MPDITMCSGGNCGLRETCYRFKAQAAPMQSWFDVPPAVFDPDDGWVCEYHSEAQEPVVEDEDQIGLF
jgi:hypothetical protein